MKKLMKITLAVGAFTALTAYHPYNGDTCMYGKTPQERSVLPGMV